MSRARSDLLGQVFGNLTVIEFVPDRKDKGGKRFWKCRCTCGREVVVRADNLKSGHSTQCVQCAFDGRRTRKKGVKRF